MISKRKKTKVYRESEEGITFGVCTEAAHPPYAVPSRAPGIREEKLRGNLNRAERLEDADADASSFSLRCQSPVIM